MLTYMLIGVVASLVAAGIAALIKVASKGNQPPPGAAGRPGVLGAPGAAGALPAPGAAGAPVDPRAARILTSDGRVWGSGMMLTAGIGAFIMAASFIIPLLIFVGEMRGRDMLPFIMIANVLSTGAWVCIGLGGIGGIKVTNGYSIVVSVFAFIAAIFTMLGSILIFSRGDTAEFFAIAGFLAPFVATLFFAIWGLAGYRGFGLGLGLPMGICGILGSAAGIIAMMALADSFRNARDGAFKLFMITGVTLCVATLILGGIGLVGRMRRPPV